LRCLARYIRENAVALVVSPNPQHHLCHYRALEAKLHSLPQVAILQRYGAAYPTLIPRTMRTLLHALLDPSKVPLKQKARRGQAVRSA
jgi:hypothetical protein